MQPPPNAELRCDFCCLTRLVCSIIIKAINTLTCFLALWLLVGVICFEGKLPDELAKPN